jgi:hypothetical protein
MGDLVVMRTHDIEATNSFAYIGTLDMENESHIFFYSPIHGSLQIIYSRKFL